MGRLSKQIIDTFGHVAEAELIHIREVGFTDGEVLSIIGLSVQFMFVNYINNVFDTKIDFPKLHMLDEVHKSFNRTCLVCDVVDETL